MDQEPCSDTPCGASPSELEFLSLPRRPKPGPRVMPPRYPTWVERTGRNTLTASASGAVALRLFGHSLPADFVVLTLREGALPDYHMHCPEVQDLTEFGIVILHGTGGVGYYFRLLVPWSQIIRIEHFPEATEEDVGK